MLRNVDLTRSMAPDDYRKKRRKLQTELRDLAIELYRHQRSLVVVLEGWDAAGKGGAIRRITERMDPRGYQVHSIAAPHGDDRTHHYLWRFWRRLRSPDDKQIVVFDRSWYGRVLVERVEELAEEREWQRAYREINDFERQLLDAKFLLVKLFLHIDREEQLRRFEERRTSHHKQWKLTSEDWRNRDQWDAYEEAVEDMLARTSTLGAPWTLVAANDKRWARIRTLTAIVDCLKRELIER